MTKKDEESVLIVDDHELFCDSLSFALDQTAGIKAQVATDLATARTAIATSEAQMIVLLDLMMPDSRGLEDVEDLVLANGGQKVIVVSSTAYDSDLAERLNRIGAKGFIPKTMQLSSISNVIELVRNGEKYFPHAPKGVGETGPEAEIGLSDLDVEILRNISLGETNYEIAESLQQGVPSVQARVYRIYSQIGARNRAHAVTKAVQLGIINAASSSGHQVGQIPGETGRFAQEAAARGGDRIYNPHADVAQAAQQGVVVREQAVERVRSDGERR